MGLTHPVVTRRFVLERSVDVSGISGTGTIAVGVQFGDGQCVLKWLTTTSSLGIYPDAEAVVLIHGHEGNTRLVWID